MTDHRGTYPLAAPALWLIAAIAFLCLGSPARADATALKGLVQDGDGTALAGVLVVLKGAAGKEWRTTADDDGRFKFEELLPGAYSLTLLRGVGGVGEILRRQLDIKGMGSELASRFVLVVWERDDADASAQNLWDELKYAIKAAPRDALRDLRRDPSEWDDPEPIIEETGRSGVAPVAPVTARGDVYLAQSFHLGPDGTNLFRGLDAGFNFDSRLLRVATVNVQGTHMRGGSLTSPIVTGSGVTGEELRVGFAIAASDVDRVEVDGAFGRDSLREGSARGFSTRADLNDESSISNFESMWRRRLPEGNLNVRVSYSRGVLTLSGLPAVLDADTLSLVQSFWSAHGDYTLLTENDHLVSVGMAYRVDRAPAAFAAWPGAYDDVAGLVGFTGDKGAGSLYARDDWRASDALSVRYGLSVFYPPNQVERAFASPELGFDLRVWPQGSLSMTGGYVYSPDKVATRTTLEDGVTTDAAFLAFMAELDQQLPDGARITAFAGTRDLRTLYLQATAGEAMAELPDPLFYTTGYARAKETGVRLSSASMGRDATITVSYLRGRTDGALSVQPYAYLRRDLVLGTANVLAAARVAYSQALVAVAVPRIGTSFDLSYIQVQARQLKDRTAESGYSLWGGRVRQDLPFLDFREARFAVLLAANQVLQDLYQLEAIAERTPPRALQVSGGIALTF